MSILDKLKEFGWYLTEEGIKKIESQNGKNLDVKQIIKLALDTDLRDIGAGALAALHSSRGSKVEQIDGNLVVQVLKVRNISAPKANEESKAAPRLLRVLLTDGQTQYSAIEGESISTMSLNTPPGTKLHLKNGPIKVQQGYLLLTPSNTGVLGGCVTGMVEKWELGRTLAKYAKGGRFTLSSTGPPPWIPFGQKIQQAAPVDKNFRSLNSKEKDETKENSEFDAARNDAIAEANKVATKKVFGGGAKTMVDANVQKIIDKGYTEEQANYALRLTRNNVQRALGNLQRIEDRKAQQTGTGKMEARPMGAGKGRGGRNNAEDELAKPSGKVSLFDYLEDILPHEEAEANSKKRPQKETTSQTGHQNQPYYQQRDSYADDTARNNRFENNISASFASRNKQTHQQSNQPTSTQSHQNASSSSRSESNSRYRGGQNQREDYYRGDRSSGPNPNYQNKYQDKYPQKSDNYNNNYKTKNNTATRNSNYYDNYNNSRQDNYRPNNDSRYERVSSYPPQNSRGGSAGAEYNKHQPVQRQNSYGGGKSINNNGPIVQQQKAPRFNRDEQPSKYPPPSHQTQDHGPPAKSDHQNYKGNKPNYNQQQQHQPQQNQQQSLQSHKQHLNQPYTTTNGQKSQNHGAGSGSAGMNKQMNQLADQTMNMQIGNKPYGSQSKQSHKMPPHNQQTPANTMPPKGYIQLSNGFNYNPYQIVGFQNKQTNEFAMNVLKGQQFETVQPAPPPMTTIQIQASSGTPHTAQPPPQIPQNMQNLPTTFVDWKAGDRCLAKYWEDGGFYNAEITAISENTFVVCFLEYGNFEEVLKSDCLPLGNQPPPQVQQMPVVATSVGYHSQPQYPPQQQMYNPAQHAYPPNDMQNQHSRPSKLREQRPVYVPPAQRK